MPNKTIDLRKIKRELRGEVLTPENEIAPPPEEKLLMTKEAAHPEETATLRNQTPDYGEAKMFLSWRAPEFDYDFGKGLNLLFAGIILIIAGAVAVFLKNFAFAALLVLSGGLVISHAFRMPRETESGVTSRGVKVANRIYLFEDLKSFWIQYDPPFSKELILQSRKTMMPHIRALLGDLDPLRLRQVLLRFLKEEKHEDSLIDTVSKTIGF